MRPFLRFLALAAAAAPLLSAAGCGRRSVAVNDEGPPGRAARDGEEEKKSQTGPPFRLPDDEGGALAKKVLPPRVQPGALGGRAKGPKPDRMAARFTPPALGLPPSAVVPPRLPAAGTREAGRPRLVLPEGLPADVEAPLPPRPPFYAGERVSERGVDAELPPPLPPLARPLPDRVSLDDATLDASIAAALAGELPPRTGTVPYERLRVPDPFPLRQALRHPVPPEKATPPVP